MNGCYVPYSEIKRISTIKLKQIVDSKRHSDETKREASEEIKRRENKK